MNGQDPGAPTASKLPEHSGSYQDNWVEKKPPHPLSSLLHPPPACSIPVRTQVWTGVMAFERADHHSLVGPE